MSLTQRTTSLAAALAVAAILAVASATAVLAADTEAGTMQIPTTPEAAATTNPDGPPISVEVPVPPLPAEDGKNAATSGTLDMRQAVEKALTDSPSTESARAGTDAAAMGVKSKFGAFFPSLSTSYGYTRRDHRKPYRDAATSNADLYSWSVNVHQDLFTGLKLFSEYSKAQLTHEQSEVSELSTQLSLILNVQTNFLNLLKAREDVRSQQDSVERLQSQLKVTQAFYDVGLKPRLDVLMAEVDLADAEDALLQAKNTVETQKVRLNTLLGMTNGHAPVYVGELGYAPFDRPLDACLKKAYAKRPDMIIAAKAVDIAAQDAKIARSGLFPQVGADFTVTRTGDDPIVDGNRYHDSEFSEWTVGATASWNVFDWGETWYGWKQAQQNMRKIKADAESTRLEAVYDVTSRHLKIQEAAKRISVRRKAVEQAKESYRMAVARYQAQVGTNTDVLDAQARLTRAEAGLTEAMADYQIALSRLYVSIGQKNPALATQ
jgi:outer membrane protein